MIDRCSAPITHNSALLQVSLAGTACHHRDDGDEGASGTYAAYDMHKGDYNKARMLARGSTSYSTIFTSYKPLQPVHTAHYMFYMRGSRCVVGPHDQCAYTGASMRR
jgi:hypothetical protein